MVEVLPDGGRLRPRVVLDVGPVLHPEDLAADKVLALWGRARPRDFYDVAALRDRYGPRRLLELAATKDTGFIERLVRSHRLILDLVLQAWSGAPHPA